MKQIQILLNPGKLYLFLAFFLLMSTNVSFGTSVVKVIPDTLKSTKVFIIPATKSYIEPWSNGNLGIKHDPLWEKRDVTNWTSESKSVVWYLYVAENNYQISLNAMLPRGSNSDLNLKISSVEEPSLKSKIVRLKIQGGGVFNLIPVDKMNFKKSGFYRFELKPLTKTGNEFAVLRDLQFKPEYLTKVADVHHTVWFSSPSAHLSFSPDDEQKRQYDWMYGEIMVPKGYDPMYTFYMSLGYHRGYFGIQVNSAEERRVIFSVWDSASEEKDRNKVAAKDRVTLISKGEQVFTGDFGNEGTGGHSHLKYSWESGKPVKFIMNARKLAGDFVVYSAWFKAKESEGWKYIASWKAPAETRYFDGSYSFIENFGYTNGQYIRMAQYYNMWGRTADQKEWIPFNRARLTSTGVPGDRMDFAGGVNPKDSTQFYLRSGGYLNTIDNKISISKKMSVSPDVNLDFLLNQIDNPTSK